MYFTHSVVYSVLPRGRQLANAAILNPISHQQQPTAAMATDDEVIYLGTIKLDRGRTAPGDQTAPAAERNVPFSGAHFTHAASSSSRSSSHRIMQRGFLNRTKTIRSQTRRKSEICQGASIPTETMNKLVKVGCLRGFAHNRQGQAVYAYFSRRGRFHHQVDLDISAPRNRISPSHVAYTSRFRGLTQCQIRVAVLDILKRTFGPFLEEGEA